MVWHRPRPQAVNWTKADLVNTLRPGQNGRHFPDDIFNCIFLNDNVYISIKIPLKFVPQGPINNILTLIQIMDWRHPGDKHLSEPMIVILLTHICVTRLQWVKIILLVAVERETCWMCPQVQSVNCPVVWLWIYMWTMSIMHYLWPMYKHVISGISCYYLAYYQI